MNLGGEWLLVENTEIKGKLYEIHRYGRIQYMNALESLITGMAVFDKQTSKKRYSMYRRITLEKYGAMGGNNRRNIDDYVNELNCQTFPMEVGEMKRAIVDSKQR